MPSTYSPFASFSSREPLVRRQERCISSTFSSKLFASDASATRRTGDPNQVDSPPTALQLRRHALHAAIPFVGFGFIDNLIMIHAGDMIDNSLCVTLALPTLVAAALGQVLSDAGGVLFGGTIEAIASRLGLPASHLTEAQHSTKLVRLVGVGASTFGIILGCLLGMTSMLFMDLDKRERQKRQQQLTDMLNGVLSSLDDTIQVEECTLWLTDGTEHLISKGTNVTLAPTDADLRRIFDELDLDRNGLLDADELHQGLKQLGYVDLSPEAIGALLTVDFELRKPGLIAFDEFRRVFEWAVRKTQLRVSLPPGSLRYTVVATGLPLTLTAAQINDDHRFNPKTDKLSISPTKSLVLFPVFDAERSVVGIVEMRNRHNQHKEIVDFSQQDVQLIRLLARHIGYFYAHC